MIKRSYVVHMDGDMRDRIKIAAAKRSMTMLDWILEALAEKLKREEKKVVKREA